MNIRMLPRFTTDCNLIPRLTVEFNYGQLSELTVTLYSEKKKASEENIFPFDIIPRIVSAED